MCVNWEVIDYFVMRLIDIYTGAIEEGYAFWQTCRAVGSTKEEVESGDTEGSGG
jgi:hypothetical protein